MKERQFQGMLNSKSVYGQSYGDRQAFRWNRRGKLQHTRKAYSTLWLKWNKRNRFYKPSWSKFLWNLSIDRGDISWSQRHENQWRKKKKIKLFRWRDK